MSNLFLIRHGQASFGKDNYDRLSAAGIRQSNLLGSYMNRINVVFDAIYCGTLERQVKTAETFIASCNINGLPVPEVTYDLRLNEFDAEGVLKVLLPVLLIEKPHIRINPDNLLADRASFQMIFEEITRMWTSGRYEMNGVITWEDFNSRVTGCVDEIITSHGSGQNIALFTSGGPISVILRKVLSLPAENTMNIRDLIVNTSITRIKYSENRIMMSSFNEYPHLELENEKDIITYR